MIQPISCNVMSVNKINTQSPYFMGNTSSTTLQNDFKGQKLNVVVNGYKNCSPVGNKLNYFA